MREEHLIEILSKYSKVKKVEIPIDSSTNALKSYAIVEFEELEEAQNAWVYFDESQLDGKKIKCTF